MADAGQHRVGSTKSCMMPDVSTCLTILGCSQRKRKTSRLVPAIDRYDGPVFRVLRKHMREVQNNSMDTRILSGRFGLIPGEFLIPRYERQLMHTADAALRARVERQLKRTLDEIQPDRLFVSVGCRYWPLIEEPLAREVSSSKLVIATGGIGGRASQLAHWLRMDEGDDSSSERMRGEAVLLGKRVRLTRKEVLREARKVLLATPAAARRFETWYVAVGHDRVAPKSLVSVLFDKPVARFRTADARRVLQQLGITTNYANR
jgi:hypothetical protein